MTERTAKDVAAEDGLGESLDTLPATTDEPEQGAACTDEHQHGYIADKKRYLQRMRRIEGQTRGVTRMIEEDQYCIDILTQVSAITSALEAVATGLLEDHLRHCVLDAVKTGDDEAIDAKLAEANRAIQRLVRS